MPHQSILEKIKLAPAASFHVLHPAKAKRMNAKTLFIPAPADVAKVINAIPKGQPRTIVELRQQLAVMGKAETACPAKTIKYWKWLAQASEEPHPKNSKFLIPWWRVLKNGKPSRHMPGGVERQVALLKEEGVQLK
jgi:alkylated DNA nucleotide flippase Atl1